ncbi:MAG: hypothetical protein WCO35_01705 [Candidatus Nomurabacteria bacterium]
MQRSITETLKKINIELRGGGFLSLILSLILLSLFVWYKIVTSGSLGNPSNLVYQSSDLSADSTIVSGEKHYIYASSRGKKYYHFNCKSSISDKNKIYFDTDESAQNAGYVLAKTCK